MTRIALISLLAVLALGAGAPAQQFEVPGDFATVQEALDAAPADSTLVIHGGTWQDLVITKPVTLVGDPAPLITGSCGSQEPAIRLDGPGHGAVVFEDLRIEWTTLGEICGSAPTMIFGGGFDQLLVLSCMALGTNAVGQDAVTGGAAFSVDVDALLVADSIVAGGSSTTCFECCLGACWVPNGNTGIWATGAITVLDSTVSGGFADDQVFFGDCPESCDDLSPGGIWGGFGGTGIVGASVLVGNSTIVGGAGGTYGCATTSFSCQQPAGEPIAAAHVELLSGSLTAAGAPHLGDDWPLSWVTSAPMAFLALSLTTTAPTDLGPKGWLYMNPDQAIVYAVPGGPQSQSFSVPNDPDLLGVVLTVQLLDPGEGLSRPVVVPFLP